jgi:hypothetical protein
LLDMSETMFMVGRSIAEKDGPRRWVVESNEPEQQIKARPQGSGGHPDEEQFQIVRIDREY